MTIRRPTRRRPRIDLIPMIDTIFFVLVFFVVASLSMVHMKGLRVDLPRAATGQPPQNNRVEVTVNADGMVYVDDDAVEWHQLKDRLRERLEESSEAMIVVNAHEKVEHGRVVDVMDSARGAGAEAVTIAVRPERDDQ